MVDEEFRVVQVEGSLHGWLEYHGPLPTTPGEAWDITFRKWLALAVNPGVDDGISETCGLCMFFAYEERGCGNCPIKKARHFGCKGTPFIEYSRAVREERVAAAKLAAMAELTFLTKVYLEQKTS